MSAMSQGGLLWLWLGALVWLAAGCVVAALFHHTKQRVRRAAAAVPTEPTGGQE